MAANQYWDRGLPNELIPGFAYTGDLLYWDRALPLPGIQSTDINIVGTAIVGGAVVPTTGTVTLDSLPIVGTSITGGSSVPDTGSVSLAELPIVGTGITGGSSVPDAGTVTLVAPPTPTPSGGTTTQSGYGTPYAQVPVRIPNEYDDYLQGERGLAARVMAPVSQAWGLNGLPRCIPRDDGPVIGGFEVRQDLRRNYFERGRIVTPTTVSGSNLVLSFQCPIGYFGLVLGIYNLYTGTGFVQGSGDIVWRLRVGSRWVRNFGNQLFSLGSVANPFPLYASESMVGGELVQLTVEVPNTSGNIQIGASYIVCGVQGWFYPIPTREEIKLADPRAGIPGGRRQ